MSWDVNSWIVNRLKLKILIAYRKIKWNLDNYYVKKWCARGALAELYLALNVF